MKKRLRKLVNLLEGRSKGVSATPGPYGHIGDSLLAPAMEGTIL